MKAFEFSGRWWLPESPDRKLYGTLQCDEKGELKLSLLGALTQSFSAPVNGRMFIVHGQIAEKPWRVTLKDCFVTRIRHSSETEASQEIFAHRAFLGDLLGSEDFQFSSADIRCSGLDAWALTLTGLKSGQKSFSVAFEAPTPITGEFPGGRFSLHTTGTSSPGRHEWKLSETVELNLRFREPISENVLEGDFVSPIQDFFSFATNHPNTLTELKVQRNETDRGEITVVGPPIFSDESLAAGLWPYEMLFSLADVSDDFEGVFSNWLELSKKFRESTEVFFSTVYGRVGYADIRFQLLIQALSLYHARRTKSPESASVSEKLRELVARTLPADQVSVAGRFFDCHPLAMAERALLSLTEENRAVFEPLVSSKTGSGIKQFVNTSLNTLYATIVRSEQAIANSFYGPDMHWLTMQIGFLLKISFLKELGFTDERLRLLLLRNEDYSYICRTIQPMLEEKSASQVFPLFGASD